MTDPDSPPPKSRRRVRSRPPAAEAAAVAPASQVIEHRIRHAVADLHWQELRRWLVAGGWDPDPQLSDDDQFLGYALRLRNCQLGVSLSQRTGTPSLVLSAVLCRGMERPDMGLMATDMANRDLSFGQLMLLPGPPPELHFYATFPLDLLDAALLERVLHAVGRELDDVGFAAVMAVRGLHPFDYWHLFEDLEQQLDGLTAPVDGDADPAESGPDPAAGTDATGSETEPESVPEPARKPRRRKKPSQT
jgi:hypothetical protein